MEIIVILQKFMTNLKMLKVFLYIAIWIPVAVFSQSFPVDSSYTVERAWKNISKRYPDAKIVAAVVSEKISAVYNVEYARLTTTPFGERKLHLDIFRPKAKGLYPAVVMVHGGGWRSGNKTMEHAMAIRLAENGFVAIPVEYRLSLEAPYPQAVFDIKSAIRWIKANAEKWNVDTTRIAIEGNSAGGQLATLVGMTNGVSHLEGSIGVAKGMATVHAVLDVDGVVNFMAPGSLNLKRKPDSPDVAWLGGTFEEKPGVWKEASPAYWVSKNSVPVLFIQGTEPRFTAGMYEMRALMSQNGIYSEYRPIENSPHTFWLYHPWFEPTMKYCIDFLNQVFKK